MRIKKWILDGYDKLRNWTEIQTAEELADAIVFGLEKAGVTEIAGPILFEAEDGQLYTVDYDVSIVQISREKAEILYKAAKKKMEEPII